MTDLFGQDASPPPPGAPTADAPLADRLRPASLGEVVGQEHLTGPEGASLEYMDRHVRLLEAMAAKEIETGDVVRVSARVPGGADATAPLLDG